MNIYFFYKLEEELHQQRSQAEFKAKQCDVVHKEPFIPAKSTRPLTGNVEILFVFK